ncbi:MAG: enoyl-CoA hydratase-related protein [Acidimicrobiales bacterium]|jgi:enoyl-CoA hydratase|nr:enoyl-CoA hydratase-related protein [Acidimicrobiales bacterium]MDP6299499.1 enoyl-CoA hydratase-related protein [Acidimicrobiales bacterium]HJM28044.1 enoyl-CoA hydratase-related protein [Acidimicrobiales bacterium]HJM96609.1 enoyl-CoA hydratase-related protein [Acidimicrobiales bacterium]
MEFIKIEVSGGVAILTLNDPDKRNAINLKMNDEICDALDDLESSEDVGCLIVTGSGKAFCAGADLGDLLAARERENIQDIYRGFLRIADSSLPTIAAVNGAAVGAGMNMALACDLILAGESSRFDSRFLAIGIHPGGGHTWRLRSRTNDQVMRAMVLFGEILNSSEAERIGLVWKVSPDDLLLEDAHEIASRTSYYSKDLTKATKEAFQGLPLIDNSQDAVRHEVGPQILSMESEEFKRLVTELQKKISSK